MRVQVRVINRLRWSWHVGTGRGAYVGRYLAVGRWIVFVRRLPHSDPPVSDAPGHVQHAADGAAVLQGPR